MAKRTLYAVLIGINGYHRSPLEGCINDVLAISDYFEKLCAAQPGEKGGSYDWRPLYLLAPFDESEAEMLRQRGVAYQEPTRRNIIDAFSHYQPASPERGDYGLLYYSGHGSYVEAPEWYGDISPMGVIQTMVCYNNREAGEHDLLDKELGYLIAKALHGKTSFGRRKGDPPGVHFLSIMDCCFSGSNTRSDEQDIKARMEETGPGVSGENNILGFTREGNEFYEPFPAGQRSVRAGGLKHGRYVNLSAARDSEKAHEKSIEVVEKNGATRKKKHGIFTYSLLKTLEQSGSNISYRELIRRVEMEVRSNIDDQIPLLGMSQAEDDNQRFLRDEFLSPKREYEVGYREKDGPKEWYLKAGLIQGIVPGDAQQPTAFRLTDGTERIVRATEVRSTESILEGAAFTEADRENLLLKAAVHEMPFPKAVLQFASDLPASMKESIEAAWEKHPPRYARMAKGHEMGEYVIRHIGKSGEQPGFILARPGSAIPLFLRSKVAAGFLADVDKAGKWESVLRMSNPDSAIPLEDILVEVKKLEGVAFNLNTFGRIGDDQYESLPGDPEAIEVVYKKVDGEPHQPAIKVRICHNADVGSYWVGGLYLDSQFGITHEFLPVQQIGDESSLYHVDMGFQYRGKSFDAIPLSMDAGYHQFGITESTDYIILYIAPHSFSLEQYKQDPIPLDFTRSPGFENDGGVDTDDWFTIKIPHTHYTPDRGGATSSWRRAEGGRACPEGAGGLFRHLSAYHPGQRQAQSETTGAGCFLPGPADIPPAGLPWAGTQGSEAVFFRSPASRPDHHISILELSGVEGRLDGSHPLRITPGHPLEHDEAILPFGYDAEAGRYFPVGYTSEGGDVVITRLPQLTPGIIGGDGVQEEKGDKSIKLFFHKVIGTPPKGALSGFRMRGPG